MVSSPHSHIDALQGPALEVLTIWPPAGSTLSSSYLTDPSRSAKLLAAVASCTSLRRLHLGAHSQFEPISGLTNLTELRLQLVGKGSNNPIQLDLQVHGSISCYCMLVPLYACASRLGSLRSEVILIG